MAHRRQGLTLAQARAALAQLGLVLKKTEWGDYRINWPKAREETAYYTDELDDAVATGKRMVMVAAGAR
jgi:hypothetical protein